MQNINLEHHPMFVTSAYVTYINDIDNDKIIDHVNYLDSKVPNVRRQRSNAGGFQTNDIFPLPYDYTSNLNFQYYEANSNFLIQ